VGAGISPPEALSLDQIPRVAGGGTHICLLRTDGSVHC
jgi:hypothetical protein